MTKQTTGPDERELAQPDSQHFELTDMLDDEQTLAEMQGQVLNEYVYKVQRWNPETKRKEDQYLLSKAGVNWACRQYAKNREAIRIVGHPMVVADPSDPEYILVTVQAQRFVLANGKEIGMDSEFGSKRQWRKMQKKDVWENGVMVRKGEIELDPFFYEKAISKAQRNAKLALMDAAFIAKVVQAAIEKKRVRDVSTAGAKTTKSAAQPADPAATKPVEPAESPLQKAKREAATKKQQAAAKKPEAPVARKALEENVWSLVQILGFAEEAEARRVVTMWLGTDQLAKVEEAKLKRFALDARKCLRANGEANGLTFTEDGLERIACRATGLILWPEPEASAVPQSSGPVAGGQQEF